MTDNSKYDHNICDYLFHKSKQIQIMQVQPYQRGHNHQTTHNLHGLLPNKVTYVQTTSYSDFHQKAQVLTYPEQRTFR